MLPDIHKHPHLHGRIVTIICLLPFLGVATGSPTVTFWTITVAGILALPYFAALAAEQWEERGDSDAE